MTVRNGICQGGPWDRKVKAFQSQRVQVASGGSQWAAGGVLPDAEGSYYWREAAGVTPGKWLWVAVTKEKSK